MSMGMQSRPGDIASKALMIWNKVVLFSDSWFSFESLGAKAI